MPKERNKADDYREKAYAGDTKAMNNLGVCYERGTGVKVNLEMAFDWYMKAAQLDDVYGCFNVGECYYHGKGVKEIYSKTLEQYGKVDILVNNAADGDMDGLDTIEKITPNVIDETFAVNVRGSILMTHEFIKHRGNYGRIINISTDAAQVFADQITYGASKATLEALTRSIALEVAKYGITVNCVAPGPTQTGWIDEDFEKEVIPIIPMGKLIQPQDIAETILFLASEQAKMLTGQVIKVSGGHAL